MKKFIFIAVLFVMAISANAQTTFTVNDSTMGYIERYPSWVAIYNDTTSIDYDTIISFDTVNVVYDTASTGEIDTINQVDTVYSVDTLYNIAYDTMWAENSYDYRAIAYEGYKLNHWDIITTYNKWFGNDTIIDSVWFDTVIFYDCDTVDGEFYCADGWLLLDGGIPDIMPEDSTEITSIAITAYFEEGGNNSITTVTEDYNFSVYPNPTTSTITVKGDFDYLKIYTSHGQQVYAGTYNYFDLQRLPAGVYFVVIIKNNVSKTYSVIKQ